MPHRDSEAEMDEFNLHNAGSLRCGGDRGEEVASHCAVCLGSTPVKDRGCDWDQTGDTPARCKVLGHPQRAEHSSSSTTRCGRCEACALATRIISAKRWMQQQPAGFPVQVRTFLLGLLHRVFNSDILDQIATLLKPFKHKDSVYAKSTNSNKRNVGNGMIVLDPDGLDCEVNEMWQWFESASYWTKANLVLALLRTCESHVLLWVGECVDALLLERDKNRTTSDCSSSGSSAASDVSFDSAGRPDLDLLVRASSQYSRLTSSPFARSPGLESALRADSEVAPRCAEFTQEEQEFSALQHAADLSPEQCSSLSENALSAVLDTSSESELASADVKSENHLAVSPDLFKDSENLRSEVQEQSPRSITNQSQMDMSVQSVTLLHDDSFTETEDKPDEIATTLNPSLQAQLKKETSPCVHKRDQPPGFGKSSVNEKLDFIRLLPVYISKRVLGLLDHESLRVCLKTSSHWRALAAEVQSERHLMRAVQEEAILMQGLAAHNCNPRYARDVDVLTPDAPVVASTAGAAVSGSQAEPSATSHASRLAALVGYSTRTVIMEERNVYCGAYNVLVLNDGRDLARVVGADDGRWVALGSRDRKVRFADSAASGGVAESGHAGAAERAPGGGAAKTGAGSQGGVVVSGHAGRVTCMVVNTRGRYVLTGSYDTSIRKWNLDSGRCEKIYHGHLDTVSCLSIFDNMMASGARDNTCKLWQIDDKKCLWTLKHRYAVTALVLGETLCVSGVENGGVSVWDVKTGRRVKRLRGHTQKVTSVALDRWHIVTGSVDGRALAWAAQGRHHAHLASFSHPSSVNAVALRYLRVVTGCGDGRVRIWSLLSGACLRVLRANSRADPVTQLVATENRLILNTPSNVLALNFEPVELDYTAPMFTASSIRDGAGKGEANGPTQELRSGCCVKAPADGARGFVGHSSAPLLRKTQSANRFFQFSLSAHDRSQSSKCRTTFKPLSSPVNCDRRRTPNCSTHSCSNERTFLSNIQRTKISEQLGERLEKRRESVSVRKSGNVAETKSGRSEAMTETNRIHPPGQETSSTRLSSGSTLRRVSWSFETPHHAFTEASHMGLPETKALLRSQIRTPQREAVTPEFVQSAVTEIQMKTRHTEPVQDPEAVRRERERVRNRQLRRPSSSPGSIDPKTKISSRTRDTRNSDSSSSSSVLRMSSDRRNKNKNGFAFTHRSCHTGNGPRPPPSMIGPSVHSVCSMGDLVKIGDSYSFRSREKGPKLSKEHLQPPSARISSLRPRGTTSSSKPQPTKQVPILMREPEMKKVLGNLPERRRELVQRLERQTTELVMARLRACSDSSVDLRLRTD